MKHDTVIPLLVVGSGGLHSVGVGKGRGYSINIPLLDGTRDEEFVPLVCRYGLISLPLSTFLSSDLLQVGRGLWCNKRSFVSLSLFLSLGRGQSFTLSLM